MYDYTNENVGRFPTSMSSRKKENITAFQSFNCREYPGASTVYRYTIRYVLPDIVSIQSALPTGTFFSCVSIHSRCRTQDPASSLTKAFSRSIEYGREGSACSARTTYDLDHSTKKRREVELSIELSVTRATWLLATHITVHCFRGFS